MHAIGQFAIPLLLVLFIVYRRIRRTVGYQLFQPRKLRVRIGIFAVIALILIGFGFLHPIVWAADAAGLAAGCGLAWFAIRHHEFEDRADGLYYRTHTGIQVIVVGLLVARLAYRFAFLSKLDTAATDAQSQAQLQPYSNDPWTAGVFFILVAYYVVYYTYILRHGKERPEAENR